MKKVLLVLLVLLGIGGLVFWRLNALRAQKFIYVVPFGGFENDKLFDLNDTRLNKDNGRWAFHTMREAFGRLGYTVKTTTSVKDFGQAEAVICLDVPLEYPEMLTSNMPKEKMILFIFEPPTVKPYNYTHQYHEPFGKVYTLFDDVVDNKKYFKFYEPQPTFKMLDNLKPFEDRTLVAMLAGNKSSGFPVELYSERKKVIAFFEQQNTNDFHLYGVGWPTELKTYKGFAPKKIECLNNYRFNICYENMREVKGYITGEKLLYPLLAG